MRWSILSGVAWQGTATVFARAARSLTWIVLGALLSPREFGAFAAIFVVIDGLTILQELGLPQSLVMRKTRIQESANSTFVLALAFGVVSTSVGWAIAPAVAAFYGDPALVTPLRALSFALVVHSLRVVPLRLFERDLEFRRKLVPTIAGSLAYVATAIGGAFGGWGIWSLVAGVLAASSVETAAFWLASPWRPGRRFSREVAREDLGFGLPIVAAAILAYTCFSLDRFALGRLSGTETLGVYAFALSLAMVPSTVGSSVVNAVLLPSYRNLGEDRAARRTLHLHAVALGGGLNLLFATLLVVLAQPLLHSVYGSKWDAAAAPLRILAFAGLLRALASLCGEFLVGAGRPQSYRAMNLTQLAVAAVTIVPGALRGGATGVAWAVTLAGGAAVLHGWLMARTSLDTSFGGIASALLPALLSFTGATVVGIAALGISRGWPAQLFFVAALQTTVFLAIWWRADPRVRRLLRPANGAS